MMGASIIGDTIGLCHITGTDIRTGIPTTGITNIIIITGGKDGF